MFYQHLKMLYYPHPTRKHTHPTMVLLCTTPSCRACVRVHAVATTAKKDASSAASSSKLAASLTPEVAKDLYYDMVLGREFEEMCAQMYYR